MLRFIAEAAGLRYQSTCIYRPNLQSFGFVKAALPAATNSIDGPPTPAWGYPDDRAVLSIHYFRI
jgi:hypothetical protein